MKLNNLCHDNFSLPGRTTDIVVITGEKWGRFLQLIECHEEKTKVSEKIKGVSHRFRK